MKPVFHTLNLILLTTIVLTQACTKDDMPGGQEEPPVRDTILTEQKLVGKWEAIRYTHKIYDTALNMIYIGEKIKNVGFIINGQGPFTRNWNHTDISYIAFNADHTYRHFDTTGQDGSYMFDDMLPRTGTWSLTDRETLELTTFYGTADTPWRCRYEDGLLGMAFSGIDTGRPGATGNAAVEAFSLKKIQ